MSEQSVQLTDHRSARKLVAAVLLMLVAAGWAWHGWQASKPSSAINNGSLSRGPGGPEGGGPGMMLRNSGTSGEQSKGPPGIDLTDEQRTAMEKAMKEAGGDRGAMRQAMEKILTPEQREKMQQTRESRRAEMDARMKRAMSPADYEALQRKRASGAAGRPPGARAGSGSGPGDDAPPPPM